MALFDPNELNFNGDELKSSATAVFESAFSTQAVGELMTVVNGIKAKTQIAILGRFTSLLGNGSGLCKTEGRTVKTSMSQKLWEPATVSDKIGYCWNDLKGTFWIWGTKNGIAKADLTATDFLIYIEELLTVELKETVLRIGWFNDTDAANYNDSPAGVITNTTDLAFFNKIDGLWKQLFVIGAANADRVTEVTDGITAKNAEATYALQAFDATDTTNRIVMKTLENMGYEADSRLMEQEGLVYIATKTVYDQYQKELKAANIAYTTERLENGMTQLICGGITIVRYEFWDRMIKAHFNNGTKYYIPHRVILANPDNLQIGTEDESTLSDYKVWFSEDDDTVYIKFQFEIDAKVVEDEMVQMAY